MIRAAQAVLAHLQEDPGGWLLLAVAIVGAVWAVMAIPSSFFLEN